MTEHTAIAEAAQCLDRMREVLTLDLREPTSPEQAAEFRRWRQDLARRVVELDKWIERERPHFQD